VGMQFAATARAVKGWLGQNAATRLLYGLALCAAALLSWFAGRGFAALEKSCHAARLMEGCGGRHVRRVCCMLFQGLRRKAERQNTDLFEQWHGALCDDSRPSTEELRVLADRALVMKPFDAATGERGVIYLMYTNRIEMLVRAKHFLRIARAYDFVLEPSWHGYDNVVYLLYSVAPCTTFVLAPYPPDYDAIAAYGGNLVPLRLGAGDWIDTDVFTPLPDVPKRYDIVMVGNWATYKRHTALFRAMATIRKRFSTKVSAVLVGFPWGNRQCSDVEREAEKAGVREQCVFCDSVSPQGVIELVSQSRIQVMLSREEGVNRAVSEGLSLNVPGIVYRHFKGGDPRRINPQTGLYADDHELPQAILRALDTTDGFAPREWVLKNSGCHNAHRLLNEAVRQACLARGLPWTSDNTPIREFGGKKECRSSELNATFRALTEAVLTGDV
jgi:glycosyltransferase involved in cell wall biosynthesis